MEINGTNGNDDNAVGGKSIIGTSDNDIIHGLEGNDNIFGNGGSHDELFGDGGNDFIDAANGGNHSLYGGSDDDQLFGANGNDILDGGTGNDFMQGGAGDDTYFLDNFRDGLQEFANGGIDTVNVFGFSFTLPTNVENLVITGNGNIDGRGNTSDNKITGGSGINFLSGRGGNDLLDGGKGFDTAFESADSNFSIDNNTIEFTGGVDSLFNIERVQIFAGASNNTINAFNFTKTTFLAGAGGSDVIIGGSGNDTLVGDDLSTNVGIANDTLIGGSGIDTVLAFADKSLTLTNTSLTGAGTANDTLSSIEKASITGHSLDSITIDATAFSGSVEIVCTNISVNDVLLGAKGSDKIVGGSDKDVLAGGAGNDSLFGGSERPDNISVSLDKSDEFVYNTGNAFKTSDVGVDTIGDFAAGIDKIVLDKRTFTTIGSAVGNGFSQSGEFKVVTSDSAAQTSSADIVYNSANGKLFYNQNGTSSGFGSGAQFAILTGKPALKATDFILQSKSTLGLTGKPITQGSSANNTIVGQSDGGILNGLAGNDKLYGKGGGDILLGGAGDDKLNGGTGDDLLEGGAGKDKLNGGAGVDTFVLARGAGVDLIRGFHVGSDRIGFRGDLSAIHFVAGQGGTVVKAGKESLAILQGIKPAQLSLNDIVRISSTQLSGMSVPTIWS